MNRIKLKHLVIATLFVSCRSSHWINPPSEDFVRQIAIHDKDKVERNDLTESEKLAGSFLKSKLFSQEGNKFHACTRLKYLASYDNFPLKKLAEIRQLKECSLTKSQYQEKINELFATTPPWLNEEMANTVLEVALAKKLSQETAKAAQLISKLKKTKGEKEHYIKMAESHAKISGNSDLINQIVSEKEQIAPRLKTKIAREDYLNVAKDFEKVRQFDNSRKYYQKVFNDSGFSPEDRFNAFDRWKLTYKLDRDLTGFLGQSKFMSKTLNAWRKKNPKDWHSYYVDSEIALARALWTRHQRAEGEKALKNLLKEKELSNDQMGLINYVLGSMELEKNSNQKALGFFKDVLDLEIKDKNLKNNILWSYAWTHYQLKSYKTSSEKFALYNETNDDYFFKLKSLFWWAKSVQKQGLKSEANKLFNEVIEQDPFGYYGLISYVEIGRKLPPLKDNQELGESDIVLEWLLVTGERELARSYLDDLFNDVKDYSKLKDLLPLYRRAHHYDGGMTQFFKVPPEKRNDYLESHIATAYPVAYTSEIGKHCYERFGLDPSLVKAIIRQESAFNTYIRSHADAFGLMQLIPEKAKVISKKIKVPYSSYQDLYEPSVNLPLGCYLLKEHLADYDNNIVITAASYNAGENVVKNWLKTRFDGDYVEFIESIPYEETKGYVKLILRNMMVYKRINAEEPIQISLNSLIQSN